MSIWQNVNVDVNVKFQQVLLSYPGPDSESLSIGVSDPEYGILILYFSATLLNVQSTDELLDSALNTNIHG